MSRCVACGADVYWARTPKGKAIPLDANPTSQGNVALTKAQHAQRALPLEIRP